MIDGDYNVILRDLPTTIGGLVREQEDYYTIILNSRMTHERNRESYLDEMDHIATGALNSDQSADQIEMDSHKRSM